MQAVCPDNKIKCLRRAVLERDVDSVLGLLERADRVAEDVLDVVPARLVDDLGQFAAHDLDVALRHAFRHRLRGHIDGPVSVSDEGDDLVMGARILNLPQAPIHSMICRAGPKRSTAWPPLPKRSSSVRSTTVGWNPNRLSQ